MKGVQRDMSFVDLKRVDRAQEQIWKIRHHLAVNPTLYFAVILADRVGFDHQFVAVPAPALR